MNPESAHLPELSAAARPSEFQPVIERERAPLGLSERVFAGALSQLTQPQPQKNESAEQREAELWQRLNQARTSRVERAPSLATPQLLDRLNLTLKLRSRLSDELYGVESELVHNFQEFYIQHIAELLQGGRLSPEAFALWARNLSKLSQTGEYDRLIHNPQPVDQSKLQDDDHVYRGNLVRLLKSANIAYDFNEEQPDFQLFGEKHVPVATSRLYFSANLASQPYHLLSDWYGVLPKSEDSKITYKVSSNLSTRRYDTIVAYIDDRPESRDQTASYDLILDKLKRFRDEEALAAQTRFQTLGQEVPPAPLSLPTGIELAPGIAYAPEPLELNYLLRLLATETVGQQQTNHLFDMVSYNGLIAALTENALALAQAKVPEATTVPELADTAAQYFKELLRASGIDPDTMTCLTLAGQLPGYVKRRLKAS